MKASISFDNESRKSLRLDLYAMTGEEYIAAKAFLNAYAGSAREAKPCIQINRSIEDSQTDLQSICKAFVIAAELLINERDLTKGTMAMADALERARQEGF